MYCEDVDFCAALRAAGYRILYVPEVVVTHLRGRSRASVPVETTTRYRDSQLAFYRKHHPRWAPLLRWYLAREGGSVAAGLVRPIRGVDDRRTRSDGRPNRDARLARRCAWRSTSGSCGTMASARTSATSSRRSGGWTPRTSTSCISRPDDLEFTRTLGPNIRGVISTAGNYSVREQFVGPVDRQAREGRRLPHAALRAAAARVVPVGRHDPRLHPPDVPAVPAQPVRVHLRPRVHVDGRRTAPRTC